jgi:lipoprotein-releasing system ATP-binding protein
MIDGRRLPVLDVEHLSKEYPSPAGPLRVLDDVSLHMEAGDRLVVMGPSGSGKSTLLSILGTLEEPTAGSVRLDGVDPFAAAPAGRAAFRNARIGFVFQEHHLLAGCSAIDNVVLPALASGRVTDEVEARGRRLLERVGLAERIGHPPARLSGGERQRVAIARALIHVPRLILADEPTGQLDAQAAAAIAELLVELAAETSALLVVVTHAASIATRITVGGGSLRQLIDGRLLPSAPEAARP